MLEIIGSLIGFGGSVIPNIMKFMQDKADRKHEIDMMHLQIEADKRSSDQRLAEIDATADIESSKALYKTYYSGVKWVDALNGTVRPVMAYAFFLLYAWTKIAYYIEAGDDFILSSVWTEIDNTIFLTIIAYFFGQRAMQKIMK